MPPAFRNRRINTATRPKSLAASASRVLHPEGGITDRPQDHKVVEWQKQAWQFYDLIGELRYGARYYGNSLSQLRLHVAWKADTGSKPAHIDLDDPPEGFNRAQYDIAENTLNRLHSNEGSLDEILRAYGVNLFVAGEGYLVGRTDPATGTERWDFYSTEQLVWLNDAWYIKENVLWRTDQLVKLGENDYAIRIWQSHPRYSDEPDSPIRSILSLCEELLLLSANVRATALSRIPAGILLMPDTMLDAGPDTEPSNLNNDNNREAQTQSALEDIYQHFVAPIQDPNSAAAVAPFILTGDPEDLEQVRLIEFDREMDVVAAAQRQEILRRMAHGIDLPTEILNGMQSINHWTAWQIEESSYKAHVRPAASLFCSAITSSLVWPAIQASFGGEIDPRLVVSFDPIDLISHIDRRMNAKDGHASLVISDSTYRKSLGFSEDDAPDEMEYKRRMALQQASLSLSPVAAGETDSVNEALDESVARVRPGVPTPESAIADRDPRGRSPEVERPPSPDEVGDVDSSPVTASAVVVSAGEKLVAIDRVLVDRLEILASAAMRRTLEKAGARIRSRVSRDVELKGLIADVPAAQVASCLGQSVVASIFQNEDLLLSDSFEDFQEQYETLTARAQKQVRAVVASYGLSDVALERMEIEQDAARNAGWLIFAGLLAATASRLLYKPGVTAADVNGVQAGEFDDLALVPASVVRTALATAGGSAGLRAPGGGALGADGLPLGLVGTGETANSYLSAAGLEIVGFRWEYGADDRKTFEPHLDLDGYEFADWQDSVLVNSEGFPSTAFFYPGDHDGCRCLVKYIYASNE